MVMCEITKSKVSEKLKPECSISSTRRYACKRIQRGKQNDFQTTWLEQGVAREAKHRDYQLLNILLFFFLQVITNQWKIRVEK